MANAVYKIVEVIGVSETSWEDSGRKAVETAAGSLLLRPVLDRKRAYAVNIVRARFHGWTDGRLTRVENTYVRRFSWYALITLTKRSS